MARSAVVGTYTYYGGTHLREVIVAISSRLQSSVVEVVPVDERIITRGAKGLFLRKKVQVLM